MVEQQKHRRWYRLHLLTWLLLFCVGASLVVMIATSKREYNTGGLRYIEGGLSKGTSFTPVDCGWPFRCVRLEKLTQWSSPIGTPPSPRVTWSIRKVYYLELTINVFLILLLVLGTATASESYCRRSARWHQFSINFILALTTFAALLCAGGLFDWANWRGVATWKYVPVAFIAFGCWCTFWTAWGLMGKAILRLWRFSRAQLTYPD